MPLALSPTPLSPVIEENNIANWIRKAQGFGVNGRGTTSTNANLQVCSLSLFNPAASGKTFFVFSLRAVTGSPSTLGLSQYNATTSDPAGTTGFTGTPTIRKLQPTASISPTASVAQTRSGATASVAIPGTLIEEFLPTSATTMELLTSGAAIVLAPGNGIVVINYVNVAGNYFQCAAKWVEY